MTKNEQEPRPLREDVVGADNLSRVDDEISRGAFKADWASLCAMEPPTWFADAKFGIFTHWGLYSVPAYNNEWYSRNMYIKGYPEFDHHVKTYGPQKEFGYKDFIPMFKAERFDPDQWLDLFRRAGARYYMPVAEHHDGFQMYRSDLSEWNAFDKGPHRDLIGELRRATLDQGLHFALSDHRAEHWWFMGHGQEFDSDVHQPMKRGDFYWPAMPEPDNQDLFSKPYPTKEYLDDWLLRVCEVIDAYRPELLYFDWWVQHEAFKPYLQRLAAYYYDRSVEWGVPAAICYKMDGMAWGSGIVDMERGGFANPTPFVWQTDTAIARNSWCHTTTLDHKSVAEILAALLDAVSKNGNLMLNVGPCADGSIDPEEEGMLESIGRWMDVNGEGIYGSRPWWVAQEGPTHAAAGSFADQTEAVFTPEDFRFTSASGAIYAYQLKPSADGRALIKAFAPRGKEGSVFQGIVRQVSQLGAGPVGYELTDRGLAVQGLKDPVGTTATGLPLGIRIDVE